jgi:glutathione S-transferase
LIQLCDSCARGCVILVSRSVMERRLEGREWLAGGQYSIADVAAFPWVLIHDLWGALGPASGKLQRLRELHSSLQ